MAQAIKEEYLLVDVGANLTNKKFLRDLDTLIHRAQNAGVRKIIITATNLQNSKEALRLTRIYPGSLYATVGVHPHEAKTWEASSLQELRELASNREVVAIGECGLDFNKNFSPQDDQKIAFQAQVDLACELEKPLVIHERDANPEVTKVLSNAKNLPAVLVHSEAKHIDSYVAMSCMIGINGAICKDESLQQKVRSIPLDRILLTSDSPFMFPRPSKLPASIKELTTKRSQDFVERYCSFQRNEPCSLPFIAEVVGGCRGEGADQVALQTTYNAFKLFGLNSD